MKTLCAFLLGLSISGHFLDGREMSTTKPNVIVIMTDDQGYPELSVHGNPILKTPHLDELAKVSVRFGDFHAAPMCAPTRGQLLTGMDAATNGLVNVSSGRALSQARTADDG